MAHGMGPWVSTFFIFKIYLLYSWYFITKMPTSGLFNCKQWVYNTSWRHKKDRIRLLLCPLGNWWVLIKEIKSLLKNDFYIQFLFFICLCPCLWIYLKQFCLDGSFSLYLIIFLSSLPSLIFEYCAFAFIGPISDSLKNCQLFPANLTSL